MTTSCAAFARLMMVSLVASVVGAAVMAGSASAQTYIRPPDFDETSGKALASYPPALHFDYQHIKLEIDIPDMEKQELTGVASIKAVGVGSVRSKMVLDAKKTLTIAKVSVDGSEAKFEHDKVAGKLTIELPKACAVGGEVNVRIAYSASKPFVNGNGLNWFRSRSGRKHLGAMLYSQGQAENNSYWFPCHDSPNDRLTSEIELTLQSDYVANSNGKLLSREDAAGDARAARVKWHWIQDKPHASYLICLVAGKFDIVPLAAKRENLPMSVYGPLGSAESLKEVFANTPEMIAWLETLLDEPYPWDKYDQVLVRNFRWGGMENTSITTLAEMRQGAKAGSQDDLIVHELAHQWLGDLITCKSWDHLWLNEGWATMMEYMWAAKKDGPDAYDTALIKSAGEVLRRDRLPAPRGVGMVNKRYWDPDDTFNQPANPYAKGGSILHMLKERLGDEVFWKGVRAYVKKHKFTQVETDDFRKVMEQTSGESLEQFFDQWCRRPMVPKVMATLAWEAKAGESAGKVKIKLAQAQLIDAINPAFVFDLPIKIETSKGWTEQRVRVDAKTNEAALAVDGEPLSVVIDPRLAVLSELHVEGPLAWIVRQVENGPGLIAKVRAAEALVESKDPGAGKAIETLKARGDLHPLVMEALVHAPEEPEAPGKGMEPEEP